MIGRTNSTNCEHFKRFHRSKLQSRIIIGEHLPSWSLSFITKIILIIFTTANDSANLAHRLLMAFSDLEKQNHKTFLQKQYDGVRANIELKPYRAPLSAILQFHRQNNNNNSKSNKIYNDDDNISMMPTITVMMMIMMMMM